MNPIITFFRDTLDGTTYVIVCSVSAVLLCACIGYLADKKNKKSSQAETKNSSELPQFSESQTPIESPDAIGSVTPQPLEVSQETIPQAQPQVPLTVDANMPINVAVSTQETSPQIDPNVTAVTLDQGAEVNVSAQGGLPAQVRNTSEEVNNTIPQNNQIAFEQPMTVSPAYQQEPLPTNQTLDQTAIPQVNSQQQINTNNNLFSSAGNQVAVPTVNETVPTMEAASLDMPQMPLPSQENINVPTSQVETIENMQEQTNDTIIDNQEQSSQTTIPSIDTQSQQNVTPAESGSIIPTIE